MPKQEQIQLPPNYENDGLKYASKERIAALIKEDPRAAGATLKQYEKAFSGILNQQGQNVEDAWINPETRKRIVEAILQLKAGIDPFAKERDARMKEQSNKVVAASQREDPKDQAEWEAALRKIGGLGQGGTRTMEIKPDEVGQGGTRTMEIKPDEVGQGGLMTMEIKPEESNEAPKNSIEL